MGSTSSTSRSASRICDPRYVGGAGVGRSKRADEVHGRRRGAALREPSGQSAGQDAHVERAKSSSQPGEAGRLNYPALFDRARRALYFSVLGSSGDGEPAGEAVFVPATLESDGAPRPRPRAGHRTGRRPELKTNIAGAPWTPPSSCASSSVRGARTPVIYDRPTTVSLRRRRTPRRGAPARTSDRRDRARTRPR